MQFAATQMDLEIFILSEEVKQRRRNIVWHPLDTESKMKGYERKKYCMASSGYRI